jgi:hypothetical protein
MNAVKELSSSIGISPKDECHIWRSKFFDQSARCESRLRQLFVAKRPADAVPHQFRAVSIALKQSSEGQEQDEKLVTIIDEILPLIELRAYLAHSPMRLMALEGDLSVVFAHAGADQECGQKVMMLTSDQRTNALRKISNLAERLKKYLQAAREV